MRRRGASGTEQRWAIVPCLVVSGLTALVYQIIWTRQLGFAAVLSAYLLGLGLGSLAVAAESRLRSAHGLPLLPERPRRD